MINLKPSRHLENRQHSYLYGSYLAFLELEYQISVFKV